MKVGVTDGRISHLFDDFQQKKIYKVFNIYLRHARASKIPMLCLLINWLLALRLHYQLWRESAAIIKLLVYSSYLDLNIMYLGCVRRFKAEDVPGKFENIHEPLPSPTT